MTSDNPGAGIKVRIALALALLTALVFWRVAECGLVNFDDDQYVLNPLVQQGISVHTVGQAFSTALGQLWHPLSFISLMLDRSLFGNNPLGYHLENLLFHVANVVLLFFLIDALTRCTWRSAALAVLFAIHPLRVESVAWAAERKDVLSMFFGLLCMFEWLAFTRKPTWWRYMLSAICLALSLLAKPMLVTLPAVMLLLDWWPLGRIGRNQTTNASVHAGRQALSLSNGPNGDEPERGPGSDADRPQIGWTRAIMEQLPMLALCGAALAMSMAVRWQSINVGKVSAGDPKVQWYVGYSLWQRTANGIVSYGRYIWKMFDVTHLAVFYPMPSSWPMWQVATVAAMLLAVTILAIARRRTMPWLLVGWLWYLGTLMPVNGVLNQVGQYSMADRYTYFPGIGLLLMLIWSIPQRWMEYKPSRIGLGIVGTMLAIVLAWTTIIQTGYWQNSIMLFKHAVACTGDNPQANLNLAWAYFEDAAATMRSDPPAALEEYMRAEWYAGEVLRLRPGQRDPYAVLALSLTRRHRTDEAITVYRQALTFNPQDDQLLVGLGNLLSDRDQSKEASDCFNRAQASNPQNSRACLGLGREAKKRNDFTTAIDQLSRCVKLEPDNVEAKVLLDGVRFAQLQHPTPAKPWTGPTTLTTPGSGELPLIKADERR